MAPAVPRLRILSVGGNAVSAFLSWRLQATNACDVTLVWKSGFDSVAQYGISFKSALYGNERFKPHSVVRLPEDAANLSKQPYDYVLLCVKALPDVYDIASIIESVVAPQHTCILMNTTHSIGMEKYLEERFPTNVVLSLVSGAEIVQLAGSEFEHRGATDIWVGPANANSAIPPSIQTDMAEALAMTLSSGQVDCKVSPNIRQQQYERMIGNIAFHTPSVLMDIPSHAELFEKHGLRDAISGIIDELMTLATAQNCTFPPTFKQDTITAMLKPQESHSILFQDFLAHRPMEVETYLGAPLAIARHLGVPLPRIEMLYGLMHHTNILNQMKPAPVAAPPSPSNQPARMGAPPMPRGPMINGNGPMNGGMKNGVRPPGPGGRTSSLTGPPPMMRRGPPPMNGFPPRQQSNGYNSNAPPLGQRRPSLEASDLEEFSHLMLYENIPDGAIENPNGMYENNMGSSSDLAMRERELMLRQRELQIREQEMALRQRGGGPGGPGGHGGHNQRRMPPPPPSHAGGYDDDDDEDDFFDPMGPSQPQQRIDPDNFDMMSVTSRRTRKAPSASQLRKNPELQGGGGQGGGGNGGGRQRNIFGRGPKQNRTSARLVSDIPGLHDSLMQDPLLGYSSNRYGAVDRSQMGQESRANSLTASRLDELQGGPGGGYGAYPQRRTSQSPGNPLGPPQRQGGRPSPPNGYPFPNGMQNGMQNGRPSPPGMRQPVPRHPPGHGNAVAPHQVEQHVGVSKLYPPNMGPPKVRSLTGSASASAESGDSSASAHLDSGNSAHSSQSSLGPRHPIGVR